MPSKIVPVGLILTFTLLLAACSDTPDQEQIELNLSAMQEAVENKEFSAIQPHLHETFMANERMDAREVKRLLQVHGLRHTSINVTLLASETTMDPVYPNKAESNLSVAVTGSSGLLPSDGRVRNVKLEWIKQSGDWQVIKASWRN